MKILTSLTLCISLSLLLSACDPQEPKPKPSPIEPESSNNTQSKKPEQEKEPEPKPPEPEPEPVDDLRLSFHSNHPQHPTQVDIAFGEMKFIGLSTEKAKQCQAWRKRKACWQEKDLETYHQALNQDDLDNLLDIVLSTEVMSLKYDHYGSAKKAPLTRLKIHLNGKDRQFSYRYNKKSKDIPLALFQLETALLQYGRSLRASVYFGEQVLPLETAPMQKSY